MRVSHHQARFLSRFCSFNKSFNFIISSSVVLVISYFVPSPPLGAEQTPTAQSLPPEVIGNALCQWSKQIDNFSMKWEVGYFTLRGEPSPIDHKRLHRQIKEFVWTKEGRFWSHERNYVNREWFTRTLHVNDLEVECQAAYDEGFSVLDRPAKLRLGVWARANSASLPPKRFLPLKGLWDAASLTWSLSRFQTAKIESYGTEWRSGRHCPFLLFPNGQRVLFDPDHNCLPFYMEQKNAGNSIVFVVEDYLEVEPGLWFPSAGYEEVRSTEDPARNGVKRWKVVDVKINQSLPSSAFCIKPVIGTEVEDNFTGFHFIYGREMPPGTLDSGMNEYWLHYMRHGGPHPFPVRHPASFWQRWRFLVLISALILCAVVLAWRTLLPKGVL